MSTKAYFKHDEISAKNPIFNQTRAIIEAPFYGNNVIKVNTLKEAYELAKNSPGTVITDMPVYRAEEIGLEPDSKVLLFNDGNVSGRAAAARKISGEPGVGLKYGIPRREAVPSTERASGPAIVSPELIMGIVSPCSLKAACAFGSSCSTFSGNTKPPERTVRSGPATPASFKILATSS
jgi:hypothetical protein